MARFPARGTEKSINRPGRHGRNNGREKLRDGGGKPHLRRGLRRRHLGAVHGRIRQLRWPEFGEEGEGDGGGWTGGARVVERARAASRPRGDRRSGAGGNVEWSNGMEWKAVYRRRPSRSRRRGLLSENKKTCRILVSLNGASDSEIIMVDDFLFTFDRWCYLKYYFKNMQN
jgi:hypothetical protein